MEMNQLQDLFLHHLRDIYSAENQALTGLTRMAERASHPELKTAFQQHKTESEQQIERVKAVFALLKESPEGVTCKGMAGLMAEAKEMIGEKGDPAVIDAGLINQAQHVEHYEIASYGTAATFAKLLGHEDALNLLLQTLEEEKATDEKLTQLAKTVVNPDAVR